MSHIEEAELALVSLGEVVRPQDAEHLSQCRDCQESLARLSELVEISRSSTVGDQLVSPPDDVWSAVAFELNLSTSSSADHGNSQVVRSLATARSRKRIPVWLGVAAASVGIVAGAALTAAIIEVQGSQESSTQVVARTELAPVANSTSRGTAVVETTEQGPMLHVTVRDLPPIVDGYYEVWMATADAKTMVALGTLNTQSDSSFSLPAGMQMSKFPLVDVSVEHFDGIAGHSAQSVVRGQFSA